ncbi:PREDICTED: uncharacterized protein LOC105959663 [Erythranthe guttata]|uniref:uncharacterized protein LOC105959663 n=1 Tax=Erythranthe guttata TaxID=4155 RepID=UPI00064DCB3F|nr:PREDICTED: uncharacterized protein LOC105959663 [Erythranthe guttata]|eukprot:XP_012839256.1 PREDICTED: uncharacterized protein LOC105959663 [Erythranthe guttata]
MAQQGSDNSSYDDDNQGHTTMTTIYVEYQLLMLASQGKQKPDAFGMQGFSPHVKMTAAHILQMQLTSACNDLNVLYNPLFNDVVEGLATNIQFTINGRAYKQGYYLADGIYPRRSTIVQAIPDPQGRDKQLFTRLQEAYRKDVERTFGILQSRFEFITGPCRLWHNAQIDEVMKCCIFLHNIIVEDNHNQEGDDFVEHVEQQPVDQDPITIPEYLSNRAGLTDKTRYFMLRNDLVEHVWKEYRDGNLNV